MSRVVPALNRRLQWLRHQPHRAADDAYARLILAARRGPSAALPVYWWHVDANFGDRLTPWLLPHYGINPMLTAAKDASAFGVGSLHDAIPAGFTGLVLGTGQLTPVTTPLPSATFLSVRGPLTRASMEAPSDTLLGDLGLLSSRVFRRRRRPRSATNEVVGLVPHFIHATASWVPRLAASAEKATVIDVRWSPARVVREMSSCTLIITSSLHGLIVADALGIPAVWGNPEPITIGADHKFLDHEGALDLTGRARKANLEHGLLPGLRKQAATPNVALVSERQDALEFALHSLRERLLLEQ